MPKFVHLQIALALAALSAGTRSVPAGPVEDLGAWLKLDRKTRPALESQAFAAAALTGAESDQARALIWAERLTYVKAEFGSQWTGKRLVQGSFQMPFDYRTYGTKPAAGYDFYISMHGGGGTTAQVNDQQWQNQILLYKPSGVYLAPRSPTDTWNMWHKDHIDGFFDRLIQLAVAYQEVNPDRVYVMGYSAGGDGAYHMTPRMADRWAAGAMMAGYPNSASPVNLRNIGMTLHVGALDAAYGRNSMVLEFGRQIQKLQDADPGFYKYQAKAHAGKGHWMDLEDAEALPWMQAFTRNPDPKKVAWLQDTTVGTNSFPSSGPVVTVKGAPTQWQFHWVGRPDRKALPLQASITAEVRGQEVHILQTNLDSVIIWLNDKLLDLNKPVVFFWKGAKVHEGMVARSAANLYRSLDGRGDRELIYPARLVLSANGSVGTRTARTAASWSLRMGPLGLEISGAGPGEACLSDASGRLAAKAPVDGRGATVIPSAGLRKGLYFLMVRSGGAVSTRKVMLP